MKQPTLSFSHVGAPLEIGPFPAIFYFTLSAEDSLFQQPYCQPTIELSPFSLRVFSCSLPEHGPGLDPTSALERWAFKFQKGEDCLSPFIEALASSLEKMRLEGTLIPEKTAVIGLSRGAFIATHLAARLPWIEQIIGFAPLIELDHAREFAAIPIPSSLSLYSFKEDLCRKKLRYYIGNRDLRVGTKRCYQLIETLAETAFQERVRPAQIELHITPSIGYQGHGTSPEIFKQGSEFVLQQLGLLK
jgi:hypothetical protein